MEARERLLKHQHNEMKQRAIRPASNQIDRFGRIAFDKNRELSQASLDVDSNFSGNSQGRGESLENRRLIHTEQENVLFSLKKRREKVKAQIDNMQAQKDPMELEFDHKSVINRLNRLKNVLDQGKVVNRQQMVTCFGTTFDKSKKYHNKFQAQNLEIMHMSENILKKQARSKQNFIDEIEFKMKKAQERFDAKKLQIKKASAK